MTMLLQARGIQPAGNGTDVGTIADLIRRLGSISPKRILLDPPPGTATEKDLLKAESKHGRLCELVEGTLVEKGMGLQEGILTAFLISVLQPFASKHKLGIITVPDTMLRLFDGTVRAPDVGFIAWRRFPRGKIPTMPIPPFAPDLAIEVLSRSNTKKEMARKRKEYFGAGTTLVWEIDPRRRTVVVYTSVKESTLLDKADALDGGKVLPGFRLEIAELFAELDQEG